MKTKISDLAKKYKKDLIRFLREIVAIPSFSGKEKDVINRIKQEMEKIGYDKIFIDPFGNLIGQIGSGKKIIAFDGHSDTVGAGNMDNWDCDPFKGNHIDRKIFGRGICDQKGGLASAIYTGQIIKQIGIPEDSTFMVVASVLEEDFEGLCWKYIIENEKIKPEILILTEPSNLEIKIGQRGRMEFKVQTRGISCHGSAPHRGKNAIYQMNPIIEEIKQLNKNLAGKSILGKGTIAVTNISSESPSLCAVPDQAVIHLDRRLTKGEDFKSALKEIQALPSVVSSNSKVWVPEFNVRTHTGMKYPVKAYYPMWLMENNHPLVKYSQDIHQKQFNTSGTTGVWDFSTNGVVVKGEYEIPCIGFGPGEERYAHMPNEQINENDLLKSLEFYSALFLNYQLTK